MDLPLTKVGVKAKSPKVLTLFGQSKVGKTHMLSQLDGCLIIDTENGTEYVDGLIVKAESLVDLANIVKTLKTGQYPYKYIAIDTLDKIVDWCEAKIVAEYNAEQKAKGLNLVVTDIGDIPYGGGYGAVRTKVMSILNAFRALNIPIIQIGHRKKTIIGESSVEFSSASLDLTGKLKNLVCADSDAIGYLYRTDGKIMISFKTSDELEVGSRCEHLRGETFEFDWSKIYID